MTVQDIFNRPFVKAIQNNGGEVFICGGFVRDYLLDLNPKDIDLVTRLMSLNDLEFILSLYGTVDLVGKSFGILKFKEFDTNTEFDISIVRTDRKILDGEGHKSIIASYDCNLSLKEDAIRRDFTFNSLFIDKNDEIIDYFDGIKDLNNKIVRCISEQSFIEDPLRLLRALQFAARFNFIIENNTYNLICNNINLIKEISAERILIEFNKVFEKKGNINYFISLLDTTGLFKEYFGIKINKKYFTVNNVAYLLYNFDIKDNAEFYYEKLKIDNKLYNELKSLDIFYNSEKESNRNRRIFNAIQYSNIILTINFLDEYITKDFVTGRFPNSKKDIAISGNQLIELGFKGKEIGIIIDRILNAILNYELINTEVNIINFIRNIKKNEE